jgi:hypothetical protein
MGPELRARGVVDREAGERADVDVTAGVDAHPVGDRGARREGRLLAQRTVGRDVELREVPRTPLSSRGAFVPLSLSHA